MSAMTRRSTTVTPPHEDEQLGHRAARSDEFNVHLSGALSNPRLRNNLTAFQQGWRSARDRATDEIDFGALRAQMKRAKTAVTSDLEGYLRAFQSAAEGAGATVHLANDAVEANRIVLEIARRHHVSLIAKSKTMVSEEIGFNHVAEEHGHQVVETDLGEWIVQLRHERPSHMVMPAVHLSRQEVGADMSGALGRDVSREDISEQVGVARDEIRDAFFSAGMGITGANALIAETGTVMMVTNEGNGRLCASVPPVHVVLAGIEKVVPTFEDAVTQIRLLARSGTAQRITSYTTFITGPTPGHQMHIILVDNGRRRMASLPEFVEALHCIRCAACANVCPPYREVSGHAFGYIYTGAIGLVVTPFHHGLDAAAGPQSLCLSCNACETVCPAGIPLPRQILDVRGMVVERFGIKEPKRTILALYARPKTSNVALKIARRLQPSVARDARLLRTRRVPIVRQQTRWRSLPLLAERPLRARLRSGEVPISEAPIIPNGAAGKRVALFPGCMTDNLYPEQGEAITRSLRALGVRLVYPEGLHCCGLPALNSGDVRHGKWMARQTIRALEQCEVDYVVSGSASCVATLSQDYLHLFRDEPAWLARAEAIAHRVIDFTSFIDRVADLPAESLAHAERRTVAYHDSCQGLNALGVRKAPRRILADVLGHEVRDLAEPKVCCGFGGSFSFDYPRISERLMNSKLDDAEATGATQIVTDNQGCILQLRGGIDAQGRRLEVLHLAQLVAEGVDAAKRRQLTSGDAAQSNSPDCGTHGVSTS
ncbi:MAG: LUD domain-containing protein [Chloroflexi bacterium]|nr:LUD domain-containing protein [Chloroflexota bacterium]